MPTPNQSSRFEIEIVAVLAGQTIRKTVLVPQGQSAAWALGASGLLALHPALHAATLALNGKALPPATTLLPGDRLELLFPVHAAAVQRVRQRKRARSGQSA